MSSLVIFTINGLHLDSIERDFFYFERVASI
jgi:hypothetical protein